MVHLSALVACDNAQGAAVAHRLSRRRLPAVESGGGYGTRRERHDRGEREGRHGAAAGGAAAAGGDDELDGEEEDEVPDVHPRGEGAVLGAVRGRKQLGKGEW